MPPEASRTNTSCPRARVVAPGPPAGAYGALVLEGLAGQWTGSNRLYFQPGVLAEQSDCSASIRRLGDGPAVVHEYEWVFEEQLHRGIALLSVKDGELEGVWVDTFHTGGTLMDLAPVPGAEGIVLQGTYAVPDSDDWGWRVQWTKPSANELSVTMWNVSPDGEAGVAVEQELRS